MLILLIILILLIPIIIWLVASALYKERLIEREEELQQLCQHWNKYRFNDAGILSRSGPFGAWLEFELLERVPVIVEDRHVPIDTVDRDVPVVEQQVVHRQR